MVGLAVLCWLALCSRLADAHFNLYISQQEVKKLMGEYNFCMMLQRL
jgi:hypothetical protein